ncbi:WGR domain-containing protein [Frigidibacter albus]|uniref:WGR domain-containing protein n=1 Tax=Frigidibacter albus TaxID=1465486 RepID=A0A6L8VB68_9RHOB|nr:WGR domain-containing protein [Frigidibacter albus]MZQ87577.1 WGR domain-containing protein [Frigidibacter albus]NBE29483.1 WGR domain-containing protein [Frigidibacter albus]GGH44601.1 WGR domain-containing protein [Frigidibacter albus]
MSAVCLRKIDPTRNMARFYHVDLAPNLFGQVTVLRSWGRIGPRGRAMIETCSSAESALVSVARLTRAKLRRGYSPV